MRQIVREGYLEYTSAYLSAWQPVWIVVDALPPVEGIRMNWEEGVLSVYPSSQKESLIGRFDLMGAAVETGDDLTSLGVEKEAVTPRMGRGIAHDKMEIRLCLINGIRVLLRVPAGEKILKKWVAQLQKVSSLNGETPPAVDKEDEVAKLERDFGRTIEELAFARSLSEVSAARAANAKEEFVRLDKLLDEQRKKVERNRKDTPMKSSGRKELASHHNGCSIKLLIEALREKDTSAGMTAKHLYSALGHRPHSEEAAKQLLSPGTVSLIDTLPHVDAAQQRDELVSFISKDDPFPMEVIKEYSALFLRLRGLDIILALRRLLYHFKLPKESQQISRVIRAFAEMYVSIHANLKNFDHSSSAFPVSGDKSMHYGPGEFIAWTDAESVEIIIFALVMLNGDLHNPENMEKMTKQQFVENINRSGATVVLSESTLLDMYSHIQHDEISFDNNLVPYPDCIKKAYVECKVNGVSGLRLWTRVWVVLCENYDVTSVVQEDEKMQRSGGYGLLYLCRSAKDESAVMLTFPLRRTVTLEAGKDGKREFSITQPHALGVGPVTTVQTIRNVIGAKTPEETRVKFRCKSDNELNSWMNAFRYLLSGGYGFWYPWEAQQDTSVSADATGTSKKTHRRRKSGKKGTLKKKKPSTAQKGTAAGEEGREGEKSSEVEQHDSNETLNKKLEFM